MGSTTSGLMLFFFSLMWFPFIAFTHPAYQQLLLPSGVIGPESFAFDCNGEGPYTGVSDGRIFKWQGAGRGWSEFAVTAPLRRREVCDGSTDPNLEPQCGRPLGLKFNKLTCELYIADAYFGLMKVGRNGGVAMQLASSAEGVPFNFTNSLDIDQETGIVYFTDSSTTYQRRDHLKVYQTSDNTSRFMKYDPHTREVTVLLRGLYFANGVALSKDNSYVLVAETSRFRVVRYWLHGQGEGGSTSGIFFHVPGPPDNIRRNSKGEYLVALNFGRVTPLYKDETIAVRFDTDGEFLGRMHGNGLMVSVSEVLENKGIMVVGSVAVPYVSLAFPDFIFDSSGDKKRFSFSGCGIVGTGNAWFGRRWRPYATDQAPQSQMKN